MNVVPSPQKSTFRTIVTWVLKNHFVLHPLNTRDVLKVVLGAGMGLPCAGDIADAALLAKLDLWVITPQMRRQFSLHWYCRFKDDLIFVIGGTMATRNHFFCKVRDLGGYFKFDPLELSTTEMVYLDLRIFFGPRWGLELQDFGPRWGLELQGFRRKVVWKNPGGNPSYLRATYNFVTTLKRFSVVETP